MKRTQWFFLLILSLLLGGRLTFSAHAATVIYVDAEATGANNGQSWADAHPDLQTALAEAVAGDEIWVAEGTYKPTTGTARSATFLVPDGVTVYGGFAATETALTQRVWRNHPTTLSGDIGLPGDQGDDVYHVVTVHRTDARETTTTLDGFWLTGGNETGAPGDPSGACLTLTTQGAQAVTVLRHLFLTACGVSTGAVAVNVVGGLDTEVQILQVGFYGNPGLAIFKGGVDTLTVQASVFSGQGGPAIVGDNGALLISSSTFANNNLSGKYAVGGIEFEAATTGDFTLAQLVMWDNAPLEINSTGSGEGTLTDSVVAGGCPLLQMTCIQVVDAPPNFFDPAGADTVLGTLDDDLHLQAPSPAINLPGHSNCPPNLDFDEFARPEPAGSACDAGAYEFGSSPTGCPLGMGEGWLEEECDDEPPIDPTPEPPPVNRETYWLYLPLAVAEEERP